MLSVSLTLGAGAEEVPVGPSSAAALPLPVAVAAEVLARVRLLGPCAKLGAAASFLRSKPCFSMFPSVRWTVA